MDRAAEVISIDDLRRRRAAREAARAAAPSRPPASPWFPVWVAWVPVWRAPAATPPLQRAAGWAAR